MAKPIILTEDEINRAQHWCKTYNVEHEPMKTKSIVQKDKEIYLITRQLGTRIKSMHLGTVNESPTI